MSAWGSAALAAATPRDIADWVLSPFEVDEDPAAMIEAGADVVELIAREGIDAALREYV